ncbi:hypothetical protein DFH27DRAFT_538887 [Peziza echinospora]|nr:hypothetical protein DFH27DRAFT_538887 [Peziza echinospora]
MSGLIPNDSRIVSYEEYYTKPTPTEYREFGGIGAGAADARYKGDDDLLASEKRNYSTKPQQPPQWHAHDREGFQYTARDSGSQLVASRAHEGHYSASHGSQQAHGQAYPLYPGHYPPPPPNLNDHPAYRYQHQQADDEEGYYHSHNAHSSGTRHGHSRSESHSHRQHVSPEERAFRSTEEWVLNKSGDAERRTYDRQQNRR